jgi:hypothetical protein
VTRTRDPVPGLALNLDGVVLSEVFEDAVEIVDDGGSVSASFGGVNTGNLLVRDIWGWWKGAIHESDDIILLRIHNHCGGHFETPWRLTTGRHGGVEMVSSKHHVVGDIVNNNPYLDVSLSATINYLWIGGSRSGWMA